MAGSNTIGTGAVILTANADQMAAGLDKAAKDVGKFVSKADRAASKAGDGKGGILGTILGVAGGVGLAMVGEKVIGFVSKLFANLEERAKKVDLAPETMAGVERADTAVRQLSATFDRVLLDAVAAIAPTIEKITPAIEATLFIAGGLFEVIVDTIGEVVSTVGKWIDETFELGVSTDDAGDVMFKVFKAVGKAIAYVWDTLKAGAGGIAVVAGLIAEGFGKVVKVIGDAVMQLHKLAQELPEAIRPGWIAGAANAVKGWSASVEKAGESLRKWGVGAIMNWGKSAEEVGNWFDQLQEKFNKRVKVKAEAVAEVKVNTDPIKLAAALDRGSTGAYSITSKWGVQNSSLNPDNPEKKQLDAINAVRRAIERLAEDFRHAPLLRMV